MSCYRKSNPTLWKGRQSDQNLYVHEKVQCIDIKKEHLNPQKKTMALLGYACDEGVRRNHGRTGAMEGPDEIKKQLAKLPNHLAPETSLLDAGTIECLDENLEGAQALLAENVSQLLDSHAFPILLGGGHDMAYAHYKGIKKYVGKNKTIGIINFDAHFDLRSTKNGNNSGTPFFQIAQDCEKEGSLFNYCCLGIRKNANDSVLFKTATELGVKYVENALFNLHHFKHIKKELQHFMDQVDVVYTTLDLDGFSSAYAPGVSAPSPLGFSPDIVLETLKIIMDSKKLIGLDVAEMNPTYDIDHQTAKLGASLVHFVMHNVELP